MIRDEPSDDSLMMRAATGDSLAFDLIVRRHQHRLQRFASRMLGGDSAKGAEIAVGALLRLWETRSGYRPSGRLESWLLTVCYRLCLDSIDRDRPFKTVDVNDLALPDRRAEDLLARIERTSLAEAVRAAVMALPETHRAVIALSVYEGMSYDAIALVLDIPAGTVASRRNHALAMLRKRLAAWEERP
jgi:RNA polymerase sigma-70 factor (ECF subfamily)